MNEPIGARQLDCGQPNVDTHAMTTTATPANMRAAERANTWQRVIAFSPNTGEEYSATPGDYWSHSDNEPLRDSEGEPMILVTVRTLHSDALTGEVIR